MLEFDSLVREDSKALFTRGEAIVESCWLISFFNLPLWYVEVCSGLYLGSSCFVTMVGCCCCCRQKEVLEKTIPSQDK